jgi:hypothetical protein
MRTNAVIFSLIAATGVIASATSVAQESNQPAPAPAPSATTTPTTPARGSTMSDVRAKFGAPSQEVPAVGQPPITRWEYPGIVVFFENDRVLHTVVVRN